MRFLCKNPANKKGGRHARHHDHIGRGAARTAGRRVAVGRRFYLAMKYKLKPNGKKATGRPAFFDNPAEMQVLIDKYFAVCEKTKQPPSHAGLAYALGFCSRDTLYEYEHKPAFSDVVKRAKLFIEQIRINHLSTGVGSAAGIMFIICNEGGYYNPQRIEHTGKDSGPVEIQVKYINA